MVLVGVVGVVFFLFQGFGDPARLILGQAGDIYTIYNIRKELTIDHPRWKQFVFYLNALSPIAIHSIEYIQKKN